MRTYLEGWGHALCDEQSSLGGTLSVVLGHQIVRQPDAVRILSGALGLQRRSSVPRQGREDDSVLEMKSAIANGHWLEKLRLSLDWVRHGDPLPGDDDVVVRRKREIRAWYVGNGNFVLRHYTTNEGSILTLNVQGE